MVIRREIVNKPIVIAGNGPSLANIDYSLLPEDFDVYRCNQFYFEDKYFLGKKIKAAFFNPGVFFEQYFTLKQLEENKEYECEQVYCSKMFWASERLDLDPVKFKYFYPDAILLYDVIRQYPKIEAYLKYHDFYLKERVTSGIMMLLVAAINGYKDVYITGIDFYEQGSYAFDYQKNNISTLVDFRQGVRSNIHTKNIDLKVLNLIKETFNLNIYYLSPNSVIAEHLSPPPSIIKVKEKFVVEEKNPDSIRDILIPRVKNPLDPDLRKKKRISYKIKKYIKDLKTRRMLAS